MSQIYILRFLVLKPISYKHLRNSNGIKNDKYLVIKQKLNQFRNNGVYLMGEAIFKSTSVSSRKISKRSYDNKNIFKIVTEMGNYALL